MKIPASLVSGDSATWTDASTVDSLNRLISSPSWTLSYSLRGAKTLDLTATGSGNGWSTTITAAQSAVLTPGIYYWQAYATNGTERLTIGSGQLKVLANVAAIDTSTVPYDGTTQAEKDLAAVTAAISARLNGTQALRYRIGGAHNGRELWKEPMADLVMLQDRLRAQVAQEKTAANIANGLGNPRNLFVRFT